MPNWDSGEGPYESDFPFTNTRKEEDVPDLKQRQARIDRGRGRKARLPRVVGGYNVVRRKNDADGNPIWLPVGNITIFEDGRGYLNLNFLDGRFNLFPKEE